MSRSAVYILLCSDDSYYVGATTEVESRLDTHRKGRGPSYTASRLPVSLVYTEWFDSMVDARKREIQLKKWSRAKKQALINGDLNLLQKLCRRQSHSA